MPQTSASATHADRGKSWMLPEAKSEDLLYATAPESNIVYVLSFPSGKPVGTLSGFHRPLGVCVDKAQDVWVVNAEPGYPSVVEYAHGGTSPIATLYGMGPYPVGCSVDHTTGNLAVTNWASPASVAVYANAQGEPTSYTDSSALWLYYCSYDNASNLYVSGVTDAGPTFGELPAGSGRFTQIQIPERLSKDFGPIQWDGKYVAIAHAVHLEDKIVYRVRVSGGVARVIDSLTLFKAAKREGQPWIEKGVIIFNHATGRYPGVRLWNYPSGGKLRKTIVLSGELRKEFVTGGPGVALSLAH